MAVITWTGHNLNEIIALGVHAEMDMYEPYAWWFDGVLTRVGDTVAIKKPSDGLEGRE